MKRPSIAPVAELESLLSEELGWVEGFRRALDGAPASIRPGLLLCLRVHRRSVRQLRTLIERVAQASADASEGVSGSPDDFEIIDAANEQSLSSQTG